MRYFCSYSYMIKGIPLFGNSIIETTIDPYDDIEAFRKSFQDFVGLPDTILLFYKKVKS